MNELYWITRLSVVTTSLEIIILLLILAAILGAGAYFIMLGEAYSEEEHEKLNAKAVKLLKICIPAFAIVVLLRIFIPTTKEALAIYGIGGTIDYIQQNDTAKQLPDKVINALYAYLDNLNRNKEEGK